MKFSKISALAILLLLSIVFSLLQAFVFHHNEIVYVDSNKLLSGYKSMVEARKEFEKKSAGWQANIDSLTRDVQDAIKKYEKTAALGSEKEKELAKELIGTKQKDLYNYQNAIKQNASQEEQRSTQAVLATVNTYLLKYGKKKGYQMILIATNGNIGYADEGLDITDKIVDDLNREYSGSAK